MLIAFVVGGFRLSGASANDLQNLPVNWKKSIALERFFCLLFLAAAKKESESRGQVLNFAPINKVYE
jgi:hypothetical protein